MKTIFNNAVVQFNVLPIVEKYVLGRTDEEMEYSLHNVYNYSYGYKYNTKTDTYINNILKNNELIGVKLCPKFSGGVLFGVLNIDDDEYNFQNLISVEPDDVGTIKEYILQYPIKLLNNQCLCFCYDNSSELDNHSIIGSQGDDMEYTSKRIIITAVNTTDGKELNMYNYQPAIDFLIKGKHID